MIFDFYQFRRYPSHYEQEAQGPILTVVKPVLTTNEKIVEACKNLDDYAREYVPAPELTEAQKQRLADAEAEIELHRRLYDLGMWLKPDPTSNFKIREG